MRKSLVLISILFLTAFQAVQGQCKVNASFLKDGEELVYDMYFKLGFVHVEAGTLKLGAEAGSLEGRGDHKVRFQINTAGVANGIYPVHDTLSAYITKDLVPIAYFKNAKESSDYTQEELYYSYNTDGKIDIHTKRTRNGEFKFDEKLSSDTCVYDLVTSVYYARALDFSSMKKNDKVSINFISGKKKSNAVIEYKGEKRVKGNDGKKYDCVELILNFVSGDEGKNKEMMKVFITNDENRLPVEINSSLKKLGSIKGIIKKYKGLKNSDKY